MSALKPRSREAVIGEINQAFGELYQALDRATIATSNINTMSMLMAGEHMRSIYAVVLAEINKAFDAPVEIWERDR